MELNRELKRQLGRLSLLVDCLEDMDQEKASAKAKQLKRRRFYTPKNNGKGRPPKPIPEPAKKDAVRLERYLAEMSLIHELLQASCNNGAEACRWLQAEAKKKDMSIDRRRKIEKLLLQFGVKKSECKPILTHGARPWRQDDVRAMLGLARRQQAAKVRALANLPIRTLTEQDLHDREHARLAVLERFLYSQHLSSLQLFRTRARFIRDEEHPPSDAYDKAYYNSCWRQEVDALAQRLSRDFVLGP